jgi:hypothetical protein
MAYQLTTRAKSLLNRTNIEPNVVFCIDGYEFCFGAQITGVYAFIGQPGLEIGNFIIGGLAPDPRVLDYISLDGTTTNITQQLDSDKGGSSSTQTMKIRVVDFEQTVTKLISPGYDVDDVLYRDCTIYLGFKDGAFPEDYIDLFVGKIQMIESGAGFVEFTIAHPEDLKRSEVYPLIETELDGRADYKSAKIQNLFYTQRGDVDGTVEIRYLQSPFIGDTAVVSTSGNLITVEIESSVTKHKTIKKAIEGSLDASLLVTVKADGDQNAVALAQGITPLSVPDTLKLKSVDGLLTSSTPLVRTFVRVDDEIIEYTGIDTGTNELLGCTRAALTSFGSVHEDEASVSSMYMIGDGTADSNAIDLALRIMISGSGDYVAEQGGIQFYNFGEMENYPNGLLVTGVDLVREKNIRVGDTISITGSMIPGNNVSDTIEEIEVIDLGTIIYVSGASFTVESESPAVISISSQYDVLPDGIGMSPKQVDIERFLELKKKFPSMLPTLQVYLRETMNVKDFIQKELFIPSGMYALPRKGKASAGILAPPLYESESKILTLDNLKDPQKIKTSRSVNKYFYNAVVTKYNEDSVEADKYLNQNIVLSALSTARVKAPTRPLTVIARGVRPGGVNEEIIRRNSKRYLDRYQFGAEWIPVEPDFKTGFGVEIGDSIVFGEPALQVSDTSSGTRDFRPRVFEVVNKDFDWRAGRVRLQIVDTNYSTGVRYGTWAPASNIVEKVSSTQIKLEPSFGSESEADKWSPYLNRTVRIRSDDFSQSQNVKLVSFDPADPLIATVSPAITLSGSPAVVIDSLSSPSSDTHQINIGTSGIAAYEIGSETVVCSPLQRFTMIGSEISTVSFVYNKTVEGTVPGSAYYEAVIYKLAGNLLETMTDSPDVANTNSPVAISDPIVASAISYGTDQTMTFSFPTMSLVDGDEYAIGLRIRMASVDLAYATSIGTRLFLQYITGRTNQPAILKNVGNYYLSAPFAAPASYPYFKMKAEGGQAFDFSSAILDVPNYDELNASNDSLYKALHPFWNCSAEVTIGVSDVAFEVSAGDLPKFFVGATIRVFASDYSQDSKEIQLRVKEISGSVITLNASMGFAPSAGYRVELIGFASDQGTPYVWV